MVEFDHVVDRHVGFVHQSRRALQQHLRPGTGLALRHGRLQPLLGKPVHLAVVAAEFTLGLAQRRLGGQRLHGGHLDFQPRRRGRDAQQRRVVALRGLQPCRPVRAGGSRRSGCGGTEHGRWRWHLGATGAWVWTPFLKNQLSMSMAAEKWHGPARWKRRPMDGRG